MMTGIWGGLLLNFRGYCEITFSATMIEKLVLVSVELEH